MVVIKPRRIEQREKGKRFKYSEGACPSRSKLSGVKKTLLVGVLPFTQENYENVKTILSKMKLGDLKPTYSCDLKMDLYLIGSRSLPPQLRVWGRLHPLNQDTLQPHHCG